MSALCAASSREAGHSIPTGSCARTTWTQTMTTSFTGLPRRGQRESTAAPAPARTAATLSTTAATRPVPLPGACMGSAAAGGAIYLSVVNLAPPFPAGEEAWAVPAAAVLVIVAGAAVVIILAQEDTTTCTPSRLRNTGGVTVVVRPCLLLAPATSPRT